MQIRPKSPAELLTQTQEIIPEQFQEYSGWVPADLRLTPEQADRFNEAVFSLDTALWTGSAAAAETLDKIAAENSDILEARGPFSYTSAVRLARQTREQHFTSALNHVAREGGRTVGFAEVKRRERVLRERTLHLDDPENQSIKEKMFPSGNYFLHSTDTEAILKICESGFLKPTYKLVEGGRHDASRGGTFGVSGNYNNVRNLLGTPNHLAGFVADPWLVLNEQGGYFATSSKSCWDELQYFPDNDNPLYIHHLRDAEAHFGPLGHALEQAEELYGLQLDGQHGGPEGVLTRAEANTRHREALDLLRTKPELFDRSYRRNPSGEFRFTSMINNDGEKIMGFHVILAAALRGEFGNEVASDLNRIDISEISMPLLLALRPVFERLNDEAGKLFDKTAAELKHSEGIHISSLYLYCAAKDYERWVSTLSRLPVRPKGIVTYKDSYVRTPGAFAGALQDPSRDSLSEQLATIKNGKTIDWEELFDEPPVASAFNEFLIRPREAELAGVLTAVGSRLVVKTLDELDPDEE